MTDDISDQGDARERRSGGRRSRRRSESSMSTIYWRDIPAQLTARIGEDQHKILLHARFQHAIDRAAGVAGLTSTHDYVQEWRSVPSPIDAAPNDGRDVAAVLDERCAALEAAYPRDRLELLVANGGLDPAGDTDQNPLSETP